MDKQYIIIEVVFATKKLQHISTVSLQNRNDCSIIEAIEQSKIQDFFPEYQLWNNPNLAYGVFGKRIHNLNNFRLQHLDRLEIYRKLTSSPNQKRLARSQKQK